MHQVHILDQEYENENDKEEEEDTKLTKVKDKVRRCLCHSITLVLIPFLIITVLTPILLYYFIIEQSSLIQPDNYTCVVGETFKITCGKPNQTFLQCTSNLCCFDFENERCYQSVPSRYFYKSISANTFVPSQNLTPLLNKPLPKLTFSVREIDKVRLQIDLNSVQNVSEGSTVENKTYEVKMHESMLGVEVFRADSEEMIFTTFNGPLIASDGFWEWSFYLTSEKLFGLGELIINENGTSKVIYKNQEDHNTLPILMAVQNGKFHGVFVEHDGPLEVTVMPSNLVVVRSLAGSKIVVHLSTGPTPRDVRKQQSLQTDFTIPYWTLGAHICRDGLTTIDAAIQEYISSSAKTENIIQFSSDCIHENLYPMLSEVEAEHELENLIKELQIKSHFIMSISPHILKKNTPLYEEAVRLNVVYKNETGKPFNSTYMKEEVIYLDFYQKAIDEWFKELKKSLPSQVIDGFVLRDNWPAEDNYEFQYNKLEFPYTTKEINSSMSKTLAWDAISTQSEETKHIVLHNKYGASQAKAFRDNLNFDFLITSSYDHGVQDAAQVQNVNTSWSGLKRAIKTTLYHSIFANSLISVPVCGSSNKYDPSLDEELCIRWYLTAATFPLFRISSDKPRRDPSSLPTNFATDAALRALKNRFALLPYFYTILSSSEPLVRPMFYDFYNDNETLSLNEQYMVGDALLVAQPLTSAVKRLRLYLPPRVEVWYEFWGGMQVSHTKWIEMSVAETDWIMFIAHGSIVPMRNSKSTVIGDYSFRDTYTLAVALNSSNTTNYAQGTLRFNKESLRIQSTEKELTLENVLLVKDEIKCGEPTPTWPSIIETANIYGLDQLKIKTKTINVDLCDNGNDDTITINYSV